MRIEAGNEVVPKIVDVVRLRAVADGVRKVIGTVPGAVVVTKSLVGLLLKVVNIDDGPDVALTVAVSEVSSDVIIVQSDDLVGDGVCSGVEQVSVDVFVAAVIVGDGVDVCDVVAVGVDVFDVVVVIVACLSRVGDDARVLDVCVVFACDVGDFKGAVDGENIGGADSVDVVVGTSVIVGVCLDGVGVVDGVAVVVDGVGARVDVLVTVVGDSVATDDVAVGVNVGVTSSVWVVGVVFAVVDLVVAVPEGISVVDDVAVDDDEVCFTDLVNAVSVVDDVIVVVVDGDNVSFIDLADVVGVVDDIVVDDGDIRVSDGVDVNVVDSIETVDRAVDTGVICRAGVFDSVVVLVDRADVGVGFVDGAGVTAVDSVVDVVVCFACVVGDVDLGDVAFVVVDVGIVVHSVVGVAAEADVGEASAVVMSIIIKKRNVSLNVKISI